MTAYDLITFAGFVDCFWEVYRQGGVSQEVAFEQLDDMYFEEFGEHRFKSFESFRYRRDYKKRH